jgi:hypothetical protein
VGTTNPAFVVALLLVVILSKAKDLLQLYPSQQAQGAPQYTPQ